MAFVWLFARVSSLMIQKNSERRKTLLAHATLDGFSPVCVRSWQVRLVGSLKRFLQ